MQLDKTHVVIRSRTISEIGDLALRLMRKYPQSILVGFSLGALPWIVVNTLLIGWIPWSENAENFFDEETVANRFRYIWLMCILVFSQAPLAGVLTTYYIGQAVFEQRPPWSRVVKETLSILPQLFWTLGVVRGPVPVISLLILVWGEPFSPGIEFFLLGLFLLFICVAQGFRPFLPEILLLERCPLRSVAPGGIHASRRSQLLHSPISGDLLGRFIVCGALLMLLALAVFSSIVFISGTLFNSQKWSLFIAVVALPLALWGTAGFSTLLRYLMYLDTRIRLEGWEVELSLRAEATRQFANETVNYQKTAALGGNS